MRAVYLFALIKIMDFEVTLVYIKNSFQYYFCVWIIRRNINNILYDEILTFTWTVLLHPGPLRNIIFNFGNACRINWRYNFDSIAIYNLKGCRPSHVL